MSAEFCTTRGFWKYPPASASLRRGEDAACANSDELVGRVPEGKTSSLTAVLLLIPTVELTCYAGRSSSMPRSLTICPEVDSGRSWRLCVDCTSFVSSRRAELGETKRARPIFAPLLLRVSSPHSSYIPRHCSLKAHVSQRQEDEAESATPAEVSELIGARASSTHRGRMRGLS